MFICWIRGQAHSPSNQHHRPVDKQYSLIWYDFSLSPWEHFLHKSWVCICLSLFSSWSLSWRAYPRLLLSLLTRYWYRLWIHCLPSHRVLGFLRRAFWTFPQQSQTHLPSWYSCSIYPLLQWKETQYADQGQRPEHFDFCWVFSFACQTESAAFLEGTAPEQ